MAINFFIFNQSDLNAISAVKFAKKARKIIDPFGHLHEFLHIYDSVKIEIQNIHKMIGHNNKCDPSLKDDEVENLQNLVINQDTN